MTVEITCKGVPPLYHVTLVFHDRRNIDFIFGRPDLRAGPALNGRYDRLIALHVVAINVSKLQRVWTKKHGRLSPDGCYRKLVLIRGGSNLSVNIDFSVKFYPRALADSCEKTTKKKGMQLRFNRIIQSHLTLA